VFFVGEVAGIFYPAGQQRVVQKLQKFVDELNEKL